MEEISDIFFGDRLQPCGAPIEIGASVHPSIRIKGESLWTVVVEMR